MTNLSFLMRLNCLAAWGIIFLGLVSCSGSGVQMVYLQFRPTGEYSTAQAITVGVAPFQDTRSTPQILGKRIRVDGSPETIMLGSPTTGKDLGLMVVRFLEAKGMKVVDLRSWSGEPEALKELPKDLKAAVTGRIEAMEVNSDSSIFRTTTRYRVRLSASIGLVEKNEVLTRSIEISPQKTTLQFDIRDVEEELNRTVMEALGRLFEGVLPQS
ncbi:MAG: hypothetical protein WHX93_12700 [bacterium]